MKRDSFFFLALAVTFVVFLCSFELISKAYTDEFIIPESKQETIFSELTSSDENNNEKEIVENESNTEKQENSIPKVEVSEPVQQEETVGISPASISVGDTSFTGGYSTGTNGQGIMAITYRYNAVVGLALNDVPVVVVKIPAEIGNQLTNDSTKQTAFLKSITGTFTYPATILLNTTENIEAATNVTLTYNATNQTLVATFPRSTLLAALTNYWQAAFKIDVATLYKNGINVPAAYNGSYYPITGAFVSVTDLGIIDLSVITGNTKSSTIPTASVSIGTNAGLLLSAPVVTDNLLHLGKTVQGTINQTQNSSYTYTVDASIKKSDGTILETQKNVAVNTDGTFTATFTNAYEYGDQITALVRAKAKTGTDVFESSNSVARAVKWPLVAPTMPTLSAGLTSLSGSVVETNQGIYTAQLVINGTSYEVSLSNNTYSFNNLPALKGGDSLSLTINGYSSRTGAKLVTTTPVSAIVPYTTPVIGTAQTAYYKNTQGIWTPTSTVSLGQNLKFSTVATLTNGNAIWSKQTITAQLPLGLTNPANASVYLVSATGVETLMGSASLIADLSSPSGQSWYFQNSNASFYLQHVGEAVRIEYTANLSGIATPTSISNKVNFAGENGGGQSIVPVVSQGTVPVKPTVLSLTSVPSRISFQNVLIPTKSTVYNPTSVTGQITVTDTRLQKSEWTLYVRQSATLSNGLNQASTPLIYSQNGVDIVLNSQNQLVYRHTETSDTPFTIPWGANEGIRLNARPEDNMQKAIQYQGQLEWNLTDAPL